MNNSRSISNNSLAPNDVHRRQNAFRLAQTLCAAYLAATGLYLWLALQLGMWQLYMLVGVMMILLISSFGGALLIQREQVTTGALWLIGGVVIAFPLAMFFQTGLGLSLGVAGFLGMIMIARLTLQPPYEARAIYVGAISSAATLLLDYFLPIERPSFQLIVTFIPVIAIITLAIFAVFTAREFNSYPLRTKLIIAFAVVTMIPLVILGYYSNVVTRNILTNEAQSSLSNLSNQAAARIDTYLSITLEEIRVQTEQPTIVRYLKLASLGQPGSSEERDAFATIQALARKDRGIFIRSIALLNSHGRILLDTATGNIGRDESNFDFFKQPMETDRPYLSNILFAKSGEGSIYFSAPVEDELGTIIGILRAEYASGIVQNQLGAQTPGHLIAVIDSETYIRIAYTDRTDTLHKSFKDFNDQELTSLQQAGRILQGTRRSLYIPAADFIAGLQNLANEPYFTAESPFLGEQAATTATLLTTEPWYVIASESQPTLLKPIRRQSQNGTLLSFGILIAATLAAFLFTQILTRPITVLTATAESISQGDLTARSNIGTQDEIGALANSFNRMTNQLQDTLGSLEQRVAERTADLESARLISERRAQELRTISEISRTISAEQRLEILLPQVTRLVSERFDFYHVGIFFVNDTKQFAVIQASNSEGGKRMLDRGHRLDLGTGIVGTVAQTGKPRIALDIGSDAVFFNNPDLPQTRSEMALPLNYRGETIGVLDVQSLNAGAFTEGDAETLSILADQIAIAIENARLLGQTQQAREEAEALYNQFLRSEWKTFLRQSDKVGYRQSAGGGKPLTKPVVTEEIHRALEEGKVVIVEQSNGKTHPTLAVPIKLRDQIIGVLNITAPRNRKWNQDEIVLAQAVSDRLALALDNARLLEDLQRRAAKEAKISEVTSRISASINMRNVLQTAVEELGRALPGSEVLIHFQPSEEK